jgi:hypothetical protein
MDIALHIGSETRSGQHETARCHDERQQHHNMAPRFGA